MHKTPGGKPPGVFPKNALKTASAVETMQADTHESRDLIELVRLERRVFATRIRAGRAIPGWSQSEPGLHVGLTQRAIHKIEQGDTESRRATVRAIQDVDGSKASNSRIWRTAAFV